MTVTESVNIRELVLSVLLSVNRDGEYSHIALKNVLDKYRYLSKQERAFITRVCQGTLEHQIKIDYILNLFSKVKVHKMKPVIREILRSGVYELLYMDSVPPSATCNEAVKLTAKKGFQTLKGFVNGVLRTVSRNAQTIAFPGKNENLLNYLSVTYSMPEWIVSLWLKEYDEKKVEGMLQAFLLEGPTSIRVNQNRISVEELTKELEAQGIKVEKNEEIQCGLYISEYDTLDAIKEFNEGKFYIQDTGSMLVAELAEVKPDAYVIDVCAAPGGKSIHLAEILKGTGMVEARDFSDSKVQLIQENIERIGVLNMCAAVVDARITQVSSLEKADLVIADLPCSGLGVMGHKTDIKYKMTKEKTIELVLLQQEILAVVAKYVKPGGTLMYSTCTIHRAENEDMVLWLLEHQPEFSLEKQIQRLPENGRTDGFFIAKLRKKG
ncbi:MAG: 16S rRNA (cytosine(967)-C(5))-methyltransferase RsmB [Lachnospiraceae bacterium]